MNKTSENILASNRKSYKKLGGYEYKRLSNQKHNLKVKTEVMSYYSNGKLKCKKCGIMGMVYLTIDHINGKGKQHRKELGYKGNGSNFYKWLRQQKYPDGYQVLCWNCNHAKHIRSLR